MGTSWVGKLPCTTLPWASGIHVFIFHTRSPLLQDSGLLRSFQSTENSAPDYPVLCFWCWSRSPADQFPFLLLVNCNLEMTSHFFWAPKKITSADKLLNSFCHTECESRLPCWCLFRFQEAPFSACFSFCSTWSSWSFPTSVLSSPWENPLRDTNQTDPFIQPLL